MNKPIDNEDKRYARQNASHGDECRSLVRDTHCAAHHVLSIDTSNQECEIEFFKLGKEKRVKATLIFIKYIKFSLELSGSYKGASGRRRTI